MNLVFLSNFFNHHQQPLSEVLYDDPKVEYRFVATMAMPEARKALGYHMENLPEYVCPAYSEKWEEARRMLDDADVVITGSAPETMIRRCIWQNKLVFRYAERPVKKRESWKYFIRLLRWNWRNPFWKPIYLLAASAYAAGDYRKFGMFQNRTYKWGYFPETKRYENIGGLLAEKKITDILWCGRFLDWKHPDDALKAMKGLKAAGYDFRLRYIGQGPMEGQLQKMVRDYDLEDRVGFLGSMKPEQVREHMECSGIYLFTSDRQEGWGAVLNEAMNSGCAVVASHTIGSVPFLLKNEENGLIYRSGDVQMLYEKIKYLLDHPERQMQLGKAAYETIANEWNAEVAAERVIKLAQTILDGEKYPNLYQTGPCSRAEILWEDWEDGFGEMR